MTTTMNFALLLWLLKKVILDLSHCLSKDCPIHIKIILIKKRSAYQNKIKYVYGNYNDSIKSFAIVINFVSWKFVCIRSPINVLAMVSNINSSLYKLLQYLNSTFLTKNQLNNFQLLKFGYIICSIIELSMTRRKRTQNYTSKWMYRFWGNRDDYFN